MKWSRILTYVGAAAAFGLSKAFPSVSWLGDVAVGLAGWATVHPADK